MGPGWVQVGQDDDLVGGQEVDSQDHHELPHHEGHVMHSQLKPFLVLPRLFMKCLDFLKCLGNWENSTIA